MCHCFMMFSLSFFPLLQADGGIEALLSSYRSVPSVTLFPGDVVFVSLFLRGDDFVDGNLFLVIEIVQKLKTLGT